MRTNELTQRKRVFQKISHHIDATFPFQTQKERDRFRKLFIVFSNKLPGIKTDGDFYIFLEHFLASLHNGHTKLFSYPRQSSFAPKGYEVVFSQSSFYLFKHKQFVGKILSIDGEPLSRVYASLAERTSSASLREERVKVKNRLIADEVGNDAIVEIQTARGAKQVLTLKRTRKQKTKRSAKGLISKHVISGSIGYLRLASWNRKYFEIITKTLDRILNEFITKRIRVLIFDLRKNDGGSIRAVHHVSGRFFTKKTLVKVIQTRVSKSKLKYRTDPSFVEPRMPYFSATVILLIDSECFSATEFFVAGLKDNQRALLIGEQTAGSSANSETIELPYNTGKIAFRVPIWMGYRKGMKPIEGVGIKPDIVVKPTLEDLKKGRDVVLKRAITEARKINAKL